MPINALGAMPVGDLFQALSFGEFKNLALGLEGQGDLRESDKPSVLKHINEGLLRLYSRFLLSERELLIEQVEGLTRYRLEPAYAVSGWDPDQVSYPDAPYIKDTLDNPYTGDLLRVLAVYDAHGCALPLNDAERCDSLFTPQPRVLQVPEPKDGLPLAVVYQARHPLISHDPTTALTQEIWLPEVLHGALTAHVAYQVYSAMNTADGTAKAMEHKARFEEVCQGVLDQDLVSTSASTTNSRFTKRGWV